MESSPKGITKIGPNRYRVRVQARDRRTGLKISRMVTVEGTARAAERRQRKLREELEQQGSRRPSRLRLSQYAGIWLASRTLKPSVVRKYVNNLDVHILPALGAIYIDVLEPDDIRAFIRAKSKTLAANTVLNMLRLLRVIAKDAVAAGHTPRDFTDRVTAPTPQGYPVEDPNLLTAVQLAALLRAIPGKWRPLVVLISLTGLRWGEASALCWEDVIDGEIVVRRGNDRGTAVDVKTERSRRRVPMPPEVLALMTPKKAGLMFPTETGRLHRGTPLRAVLDKAVERSGVPRVTTHGLRRTFNNLARTVADRQIVKSIMGHTTDEMHEHYSSIGADERAAVQARVREMVDAPKAGAFTDAASGGEAAPPVDGGQKDEPGE